MACDGSLDIFESRLYCPKAVWWTLCRRPRVIEEERCRNRANNALEACLSILSDQMRAWLQVLRSV